MAGLLAGAVMRKEALIYEAAQSLPNNHHALLRFRSDEISHHLNIPFTPVEVIKVVKPFRNKVAEAIGYSLKTNGRASVRSVASAEGKVSKRFIAPPDFIQLLEEQQQCQPMYNTKVDLKWIEEHRAFGPIISTMPMGKLMEILKYPHPANFSYVHSCVIKGEVKVESDICATIYYPDPEFLASRATLTGNLLQVELTGKAQQYTAVDLKRKVQEVMSAVMEDFGMDICDCEYEVVPQRYAKIAPIPDRERRKFIMWATDNFGVFSLGRFAVWKPGLLLDDVFKDIQKIQGMIREGHNYDGRLPLANQ